MTEKKLNLKTVYKNEEKVCGSFILLAEVLWLLKSLHVMMFQEEMFAKVVVAGIFFAGSIFLYKVAEYFERAMKAIRLTTEDVHHYRFVLLMYLISSVTLALIASLTNLLG